METRKHTPYISDELIEFLDNAYPERTPELTWTEREIWARAGERRLVRHLKKLYENQLPTAQITKPKG